MLREIMINLFYIVAIMGLLYLAYAIVSSAIEVKKTKIKELEREKKLDKMLDELTKSIIKDLVKEQRKKDTKKK